MRRALMGLGVLVFAQAAVAAEAPYYGPMKAWHGWGFKYGYEDRFARDGTWRVDAATRHGWAIDVAMYRTAERARDAGYRYVQFLGGSATDGPGYASATVYARPSRSPAAPADCRSRRAGTCYTADVAEVMRRLGGATGATPGVAVADHRDQYGREVFYSGFGVGAASAAAAPRQVAMTAPVQPLRVDPRPADAERYEALLRAAQPVRGREPRLGWTVTD